MFVVAGVPQLKVSKEVIPVSSIPMDEERRSNRRVVKSGKARGDASRAAALSAKHDTQEQSRLRSSKPGSNGLSQSGGADDALRSMDVVSSSGSGEGDAEHTLHPASLL